jgi:hydroxyacylglutathione hydrolase
MLLKYFYDSALAHASYLVGCQRTGEAILVDPGRDIEFYLEAAKKEWMRIVGVAETHIHADFVSGARELADRIDAKLYVSDCGPAEWKYGYAREYKHQLLKDGDVFGIGKVEFKVLHTPGHTPESISFMLTDRGGGADQPMGIFTGDFVFVGSIGRPDLLEEAAGVVGSAEIGARDLFRSIQRFKTLPDFLQIWPAHGAGSACGKGLGAIPSSTVGYEKLFNPALQFTDEEEFVQYILSEQPEAPTYFAVMKRVNKVGPALLGPDALPKRLPAGDLLRLVGEDQLVDTSPLADFAGGHVPGSLNLTPQTAAIWGGWLIDYERPVYLIATAEEIGEVVRVLQKIGIDDLPGWFETSEVARAGLNTEAYPTATPEQLVARIRSGEVTLIDVRNQTEWDEGHIPQARHLFLGRLPKNVGTVDFDKPIVVQCRTASRSAIAASVFQSRGAKNVINMAGGITAWQNAGLPVERTAQRRQAVYSS